MEILCSADDIEACAVMVRAFFLVKIFGDMDFLEKTGLSFALTQISCKVFSETAARSYGRM